MPNKVALPVVLHLSRVNAACVTGLTKVGMPGAQAGLKKEDPTIAELLKGQGYATGQSEKII
jgi:arylsulfatase A-like enzyme